MIKTWVIWNFKSGNYQPIPFQPAPEPETLDEFTLTLPAGAYTTFRTYQKLNAVMLEKHLDRLEETSALSNVAVQINHPLLRGGIRKLLPVFEDTEARIRLIVPFGTSDIYIAGERLNTPAEESYRRGTACLTQLLSRSNPKAKDSSFIKTSAAVKANLTSKVEEVLMVSSGGTILEGMSSNFFAIRHGIVYTAEKEVLSGTTRTIILQLMEEAGVPVVKAPYPVAEVGALDEAFISSVSRGILPVTAIDQQKIGAGVPGPVTLQLMAKYQHYLQEAIEPI